MDNWLEVLQNRVDEIGLTNTGAEIGYNRSTVSLVLSGKYPASSTDRVRAAVEATYGHVDCPQLETNIPAALCKKHRTASMPQSSASDLRFWRGCQTCSNNPNRENQS